MSIVQVHGGGGRVAADRTSFVGVRVPPEIKTMVKKSAKMDRDVIRKLLKLVMQSLEGEVSYGSFSSIVEGAGDKINEETLGIIYTGLLSLVKCAMRHSSSSLKQQHFKEDLEELGIPAEFHEDLTSCVFGTKRPSIDSRQLSSRPRLPRLLQLKWRVDVAISTSVLNRVLEPSVIMEMTFSNGITKVFEIPVSQFHQLRYNVAYVLKQMEDLEKRSILKIQD
ncbi:COMM domain-containing protein 5-like [Babylonia areolata]|uniref:COMM domain-containing protein 5-like n=1 Tax=Babylonia areolata TaxID=304850 RepID=UPI003FD5405F